MLKSEPLQIFDSEGGALDKWVAPDVEIRTFKNLQLREEALELMGPLISSQNSYRS